MRVNYFSEKYKLYDFRQQLCGIKKNAFAERMLY